MHFIRHRKCQAFDRVSVARVFGRCSRNWSRLPINSARLPLPYHQFTSDPAIRESLVPPMPHKRTTAELQEHGRVLYKRKEYAKALELFNEAITSEPNLTVSLLDHRSATHEKLGDITSALKDAKNVIRLDEKDPTGYLRAGSLLHKADKNDIALGIYKHGIKKKCRNVELLVKMHDRLLRSNAPPTAADPFAQLPIEIVEMILAQLSFRQKVACTRVSKQWNTLIAALPSLWTSLDLSGAKKPVKNKFISHCINRSQRQITTAHLKLLASSEKAIDGLIRNCKDLSSFTLVDGGLRSLDFVQQLRPARNLSLLRLGPNSPIGSDTLTQVLRELSTISDLEVSSVIPSSNPVTWLGEFPLLKRLYLAMRDQTTLTRNLAISGLTKRAPNLISLTLRNFYDPVVFQNLELHPSKLECLDLGSCTSPTIVPGVEFPSTLRVLCTPEPRRDVLDPGWHLLEYYLPHLTELTIKAPKIASVLLSNAGILDLEEIPRAIRDGWRENPRVMRFLSHDPNTLSKLRLLKIAHPPDTVGLSLLLSSPRLSNLEHLTLSGSHEIVDDIAEIAASTFRLLETLDLTSTAVTGYGLKKIVEGCSSLKYVRLDQCTKCSPDAVEWARSRGIKVDYSMNEGKGKKVRQAY